MTGRSAGRDPVIQLLDRLGRSGRLGREVAVRADILRSAGLAAGWRRFTDDRRLRHLESRPGEDAYRRIWGEAAEAIGAEISELPGGFLEIRTGGARTRVQDNLVMLDDAVTLRFALQKTLVSTLLAGHGLPVPEWAEFDSGDLSAALQFMTSGPVPCVVKPVASSGGYAVTSGIRTEADLLRARLRAARVDRRLMIERQAQGVMYRFLLLEGELLDVVRRHPPRVVGDGRSTIGELIAAENRRRIADRHREMLWPLRVDLDCVLTLQSAGLSLSSVPASGQAVAVKTVVSQSTTRDNETVREEISPELVAEARRAAELVGMRLAGVDVITPDIGASLANAGGVILEVNGPPGLNYHYDVADPANATRVAIPILKRLLTVSG